MLSVIELETEKQILYEDLRLLEETATTSAELEKIRDLKKTIQRIDEELLILRNRERAVAKQMEKTISETISNNGSNDIRPGTRTSKYIKRETKTYEILLVEDNEGDVRLAIEIFKKLGLSYNLNVTANGVEALAFLHREGIKYQDARRPDLILLDLNMSQKDGRETLAEIKADSHLRSIPVIVFTTSEHERDIFNAYHNFANAYVVKPRNVMDYTTVMKTITDFWLDTAKHLLR